MNRDVIFLGSKAVGYHCLEILLEKANELSLNIKAVVSNNRSIGTTKKSLQTLAEQCDIPFYSDLEQVEDPSCAFLFSVQYHKILSAEQLSNASLYAINLHMAPLPEYRGCNQFSLALLNNDSIFGTTLHVMDQGIDSGDIIAEYRFPIPDNCWVSDLIELTTAKSIELFKDSLKPIVNMEIQPVPQSELIPTRGTSTHYRHEINDMKRIPKGASNEVIMRILRATFLPGFPPPYSFDGTEKLYYLPKQDGNYEKLTEIEYGNSLR